MARSSIDLKSEGAAGRLVACYQLLQACLAEYGYGLDEARPGYATVDGHVAAAGYVVAEMNISARRAETMLTFAWGLHTRYAFEIQSHIFLTLLIRGEVLISWSGVDRTFKGVAIAPYYEGRNV